MAQERLSMRCKCQHHRRKVLEVLRLKWEYGLSNRAISRSCGIAASTVSDYVQRAAAAGLTWPVSGELDEDQVFRLLFPSPARATERAIPVPDWVQLHTELRRKGVTLRLLWLEYREAHPDGYGYSQFCELYRHWAKTLNPPMRLSHKGGEELFVDYAGQTVPVVDVETGEIPQVPDLRPPGAGIRGRAWGEQLHLRRGSLAPGSAQLDRGPCARLLVLRWGPCASGPGQPQSRCAQPLPL